MAPSDFKIAQKFAENKLDFYAKWGMKGHNGIDYSCPNGSSIVAPCNMEITNCYSEAVDDGYGTAVFARSTNSFMFKDNVYKLEMVFGHLESYSIAKDDWVNQGKTFALSDNTGKYTTGPHLHFGCRIVRETGAGGWQAIDLDNGYKGYIDPEILIDYSLALKKYEYKIVYTGTQNGAKHYLVFNDTLQWIEDEVAFFLSGFDFKDAVYVPANIINSSPKAVYQLDYTNPKVVQAKNLLGFVINNPKRAKELMKKYF